MTPTARYADLLLPATTFLENHDIYTAYGHFYLGVAHQVIEPVAEAKSNFDLFQGLALKMGFTDRAFYQTCEERIADYLQNMQGLPEGLDITEVLAGHLVHSVNSCSDGRALARGHSRFSFTSKTVGSLPQVPCLTRAGEFDDHDLLARFPLRLIVPPHADLLNSTFGERYPGRQGEVLIHPDDATRWGVRDGAKVILKNHRGRVTRIARLTADTRLGVLVAEGIFWPVDTDDTGVNDLTSQKLTDMGGGATFHETLVTIAEEGGLKT